jgi:formylglycine-generating enzyme required for sulfatase activity
MNCSTAKMQGLVLFFLCIATLFGCGQKAKEAAGGKSPTTKTIKTKDSAEMVLIPAGTFTMGREEPPSERPEHQVYLDAYYIDKYEVTTEQFCAFLNEEGSDDGAGHGYLGRTDPTYLIEKSGDKWQPKSGYAKHPIDNVTWYGAAAYAKWAGKRLPTEAEWERAAKGDNDVRLFPWSKGNDDKTIDETYTNYGFDLEHTTPVGSYEKGKSPHGCYDMAGNVDEWCNDLYENDYYSKSPKKNPQGPSGNGGSRVKRGGSYQGGRLDLLCHARSSAGPNSTWPSYGFRCAKTP